MDVHASAYFAMVARIEHRWVHFAIAYSAVSGISEECERARKQAVRFDEEGARAEAGEGGIRQLVKIVFLDWIVIVS